MKTDDFSEVMFFPQYRGKPKHMDGTVEAFDTETKSGDIKVIASSTGAYCPNDTEECLTFIMMEGKGINFFYNMDYDVSAIMKPHLRETRELESLNGFMNWSVGRYDVDYLQSKHFTIRDVKGKRMVRCFDLAQFYGYLSLGKAASQYLKMDLDAGMKEDRAKLFELHTLDEIKKYCMQDCVATQKLGELFVNQNVKMGAITDRYYSTAALAQKAFLNIADYPMQQASSKFLHRYGFESYHGGWFDMYQRGYFDKAHSYDIVSAYPDAMRMLPDLRDGEWVPCIDGGSTLGFVMCRVRSKKDGALPIVHKFCGMNIYPLMDTSKIACLTLEEFRKYKGTYRLEPLHSVSFIENRECRRPFKKYIEKFFSIKSKAKGIERMNSKIFMNSLYGKIVQLVPFRNKYRTSGLTNFIYGAHITAGCRLKVYEAAKKAHIVQILTDSLITTNKLELDFGSDLGQWEPKFEDVPLLSLKCGIYTYGDGDGGWTVPHTRGFGKYEKNAAGEKVERNLFDVVRRGLSITDERPWKIRNAMVQGKVEDIARFDLFTKEISLEESKRWFKPVEAISLLDNNQGSQPFYFSAF